MSENDEISTGDCSPVDLLEEEKFKVEIKEEDKAAEKSDVLIYQEKLIRLERHFSEKVKALQAKITEFIPEILKTQLDDLLLKFHNEISEEFQKLKNPISGDMPPPATAQTSQTKLATKVPIIAAPTIVCPTIQAAPLIQLPPGSVLAAPAPPKVVIPTPQVEKIIVNGQTRSVVVQPNQPKLPLMATLIRKRDPKGGGKITKIPATAQVKVVPIRRSERRPKPTTVQEKDKPESLPANSLRFASPLEIELPPEETTFEVDYDYWTYERVQKEYERVSELGDEDDFDCKICRRNFSTKAYLKSHLRAHRAPLKICKAEFRLQTKLEKHMLTHRSDDKQMCEIAGCGKIFDTKKELVEHKKSHKPKFVCNICGKFLATEKVLTSLKTFSNFLPSPEMSTKSHFILAALLTNATLAAKPFQIVQH
ncbi:unnamed protein product [Oikopleura dioica]|uniref:C2H2-type domain-containing protein n=1 Tax=Oikopleura dioica TaxID=34765 RepID=E4YBJ7_OIKDI|nr:unnamed protein product [Oikopleura dioica]